MWVRELGFSFPYINSLHLNSVQFIYSCVQSYGSNLDAIKCSLHSSKMKRKRHICLLKMLTKPHNFLSIVSHLWPIVISFTEQEEPLSWAWGVGFSHCMTQGTESIPLSKKLFLKWQNAFAHGITEQVLLLLESSWIIVFFCLSGELCCGQGQEVMQKYCRRVTFCCQGRGHKGPDLFPQGPAPTEVPNTQ